MDISSFIKKSGQLSDDEDQYDRSLSKEAENAIKQIKYGVEYAGISNKLENSDLMAYINLRTFEKETWCIELSITGYMVVSKEFDRIDLALKEQNTNIFFKFETIESLLHQISPLFVKKFNDLIIERLQELG